MIDQLVNCDREGSGSLNICFKVPETLLGQQLYEKDQEEIATRRKTFHIVKPEKET